MFDEDLSDIEDLLQYLNTHGALDEPTIDMKENFIKLMKIQIQKIDELEKKYEMKFGDSSTSESEEYVFVDAEE